MNKQQKDQEQQYKYLKFDCEMRSRAVEIASSLPTSKNVKSLLENSGKIAKYIFFGTPEPENKKK
jgi:hypothetical protein|tara:strand:- start:32 stop:226 length:195 start_codon:yes stop_codon:yes gene_type:complete